MVRTSSRVPGQPAARQPDRSSTLSFGWSVGFDGRRAVVALLVAFTAAVMGQAVFAATTRAAGYDPAADPNSMYSITQRIGAQDWWSAGFTGDGVDVALIDTGCSPVAGLDEPGKLVSGRTCRSSPRLPISPSWTRTATERSWPG